MINIDKICKVIENHISNYSLPVIESIQKKSHDPFKVLLSTILSARTKDKVTRTASQRLFKKVKSVNDLKKLSIKQIEELIYPVGFYKNKAKYLKKLPNTLTNNVPDSIEELIKLPGVGRKTANLVLSIGFDKDGICVDTHVHRIMNRIGYVKTKTPLQTEMQLREKLPKKYWKRINTLLVLFGQNLCRPISPYCSKCPIIKYCNRVGVKKSR